MAIETPAARSCPSTRSRSERAAWTARRGSRASRSTSWRRAGLLGLAVPERFGGAGAGPTEIAEAVERIAGACASTGMVFVMHVVAMQTLAAGTADGEPDGPKHAALAAAARGEHLSTLAYSERGSRGHFWAQVSRARARAAAW